jgi:hypothetical protein
MLRTLPLLVITGALTVLSGYVHGLWTGRWADSAELDAAVARLDRVPAKIGDWEGQAEELDARAVRLAGFRGYLTRQYKNRRTGATVNVLLACGRPGPLSVHTPDVCYRGAGFRQLDAATKHTPGPAGGSAPDEFWMANFNKNVAGVPTQQRVLWAWSTRGGWQAPDNPRLTFAGGSALYKLYVINPRAGADGGPAQSQADEFLRQLLPELQQALFAKP